MLALCTTTVIHICLQFSHRGPQPFHVPGFGGVGSQLLEAQGGRLAGEAGVLKKTASLHTLLLQLLIVLVEEVDCLFDGAHALSL